MTKKVNGNVTFITGIEGISRKIALRKDTCVDKIIGVASAKVAAGAGVLVQGTRYLGVVSRKRMVLGHGEVPQSYLFMRTNKARTIATEQELLIRTKFTAINQWVATAWKNLNAIAHNQEQFLACKADLSKSCAGVGVSGFSNMRHWMTAVASAIYGDYEEPQTLPQDYKLPAAA